MDRQADRAIEIYHQIREEILRGDILGVQRLTDLKIDVLLLRFRLKGGSGKWISFIMIIALIRELPICRHPE